MEWVANARAIKSPPIVFDLNKLLLLGLGLLFLFFLLSLLPLL